MNKLKKAMTSVILGAVSFNSFSPLVLALNDEINLRSDANNLTESSISITPKGNLEVETHFVLPIINRKTSDISLTIYDSDNNKASISLKDTLNSTDGLLTGTVTLGNQNVRFSASKRDTTGNLLSGIDYDNNIVYFAVNFYEILTGTYKIELKGTNFVTYTTDVTLADFSKRLTISNEKSAKVTSVV